MQSFLCQACHYSEHSLVATLHFGLCMAEFKPCPNGVLVSGVLLSLDCQGPQSGDGSIFPAGFVFAKRPQVPNPLLFCWRWGVDSPHYPCSAGGSAKHRAIKHERRPPTRMPRGARMLRHPSNAPRTGATSSELCEACGLGRGIGSSASIGIGDRNALQPCRKLSPGLYYSGSVPVHIERNEVGTERWTHAKVGRTFIPNNAGTCPCRFVIDGLSW